MLRSALARRLLFDMTFGVFLFLHFSWCFPGLPLDHGSDPPYRSDQLNKAGRCFYRSWLQSGKGQKRSPSDGSAAAGVNLLTLGMQPAHASKSLKARKDSLVCLFTKTNVICRGGEITAFTRFIMFALSTLQKGESQRGTGNSRLINGKSKFVKI